MQLDDLARHIDDGTIDTVVVAFTDHYGRLLGKRLDARFFAEHIAEGAHACDYLLTVDMEMEPVPGYASATWEKGYGDFHLVPDLTTLRLAAWADRTAMVLCDVHDDVAHHHVSVAPRSILRAQVERAARAGFETACASELEFFLFRSSYREAQMRGYRELEAAGWYVEDYHLLQSARVEDVMGPARRVLSASGIPIESTKGEAAVGQHELNVRYGDALTMADHHSVMKHGLKVLADSLGVSVSFMAKPDASQPGSSCHLHLSLWADGRNAFADPSRPDGRGDAFRWFLGGWMQHTPALMVCYAPTINSYKRFQSASWAPTRVAWSTDNRTVGFRVVGDGRAGDGSSLRIECRIPGADVNPYLAFAAALASGLDGIEQQIEPPPEFSGDAYVDDGLPSLPATLHEAAERFGSSDDARRLLGDDVVDHYHHFARSEIAAFDRSVTDWEMRRYFERI
ncbi:MAG: glutamine synthetase family protein [Acidimicrobiales bacterium]